MKKKQVAVKNLGQTVKTGIAAEAKPTETVKTEVKDTVKTVEAKISEKVTTAAAKTSEAVSGAAEKAGEKVNNVAAKANEKVVETAAETKEAVKTAAKKTAEKVVAKKETKKATLTPEVYIQYTGREANQNDVIEKVKASYVADGHRAGSIKSLQVYLKPEEDAAYYVINQKYAGRVSLF